MTTIWHEKQDTTVMETDRLVMVLKLNCDNDWTSLYGMCLRKGEWQYIKSLHHTGWRPCRRIAEYVQATENRQHRIRRDRGNSRRVWAFTRIELYYVNYGWLDEPTDRGYWLLVDAKQGRRSK